MEQLFKSSQPQDIVTGDNNMLRLIQSKNWSDSVLGPMNTWPTSLRVALDIILHSGYPMFIWWGPELIMFHNDAYLPVLGQKHPEALGRSAREVWSEIWYQIGEIVDNVFDGETFFARDLQMYLGRKGFMEETYWTFSYSPVLNDDGQVGGLFCACNEESVKIFRERRLNCIKNLSGLSAKHREIADLCKAVVMVMDENERDIPFSALYLFEKNPTVISCYAKSRGDYAESLFPAQLDTSAKGQLWDIQGVLDRNECILIEDLKEKTSYLPPFDEQSITSALILPLLKPGQGDLLGVLICGLSPYLEISDEYKNFLGLVASQISGVVADVRTFEEERRVERALLQYEQRFRELADSLPIIIWLTDAKGNNIYTNRHWLEFSGLELNESMGFGWLNVVHPQDVDMTSKAFRDAFEDHRPFTINYRLRDKYGDYYWHMGFGIPRLDEAGNTIGFIGAAFDMHERKLAEDQLQHKEEELRLALEATNLGTWDYYPATGALQWSDICKEIFGIPTDEVMTYQKFLDSLHDDDREMADQKVKTALNGQEHYDIEYRVIRKTDGLQCWVRATGAAYFNERGEAIRFIGTAQDITDRKEAEQEKNDFLQIAGHELRTPLTSMVGYLGLIQRMAGDNSGLKNYVDKCMQSTLKMKNLIADFLDFSRAERGDLSFEMTTFNLSVLVSEAINTMEVAFPSHPIRSKIKEDLYINGDRSRIEQVIINLLSNARKYSPEQEYIKVELCRKDDMALLHIRDQGIGMHQKEVNKIFRKFYRVTKDTKIKGMGLGLYIVKKIIEYHNGQIEVKTLPGKGTKFTIGLPIP